MCGITGYVSFDRAKISRDTLVAMTNSIAHRGPDDNGCFLYNKGYENFSLFRNTNRNLEIREGHVGLGHRRLSIIDLTENGWQPMLSKNKNLCLVFNGEIYNYIELREELQKIGCRFNTDTDTEVVIQACEQWGLDCLARFNGMWAIAIYDLKNDELILSRDRYGKKPLYYFMDERKIVFSSEIKSIFQYPGIPKQLNIRKLVNYTARHYRYVDNDTESFFAEISQVPKSGWMKVDNSGQVQAGTYWDLEPALHRTSNTSEETATEEFMALLEDAVKLRLRSDVPVGAFLSGGIDSPSIVALAAKLNPNFQTISSVTGQDHYDESEYMQAVIDHTGVKSTFIYPKPEALFPTISAMMEFHDEPICTVTWYSMYLMVREASQCGIIVMLTGHGGDELLAGYWDHYQYNFHDLRTAGIGAEKELRAWQQNYGRPMTEYEEFKLKIKKGIDNRYFEAEKFSNYMNCLSPGIRDMPTVFSPVYETEASSELTRRLYVEILYETIPASLRAEDRNFMAFSIENRVPFLDYRLAEYCFPLDNRMKIQNGFGKHILRKGTKGLLPNKVRWRKDKVGHIVPADEWFRNENRSEIEALLSHNNIINKEIYDIEAVKEIFARHVGGENHYMFLWQFINTHLWHDKFFGN